MSKKKEQPKTIKRVAAFRPDPEDDVYVVNGYDAKKSGPFIPKIYKVKRKQLKELLGRGWKYLPDFHREKYWEQQRLLKAYQEMFDNFNSFN